VSKIVKSIIRNREKAKIKWL